MQLTPLQALKKTVAALQESQCSFCLVGGHAASLYRSRERFTGDVDFALVGKVASRSRAIAEASVKALGLKPVIGVIPLGKGEKARKAACMVTSQPEEGEVAGLVDILLPELPWVPAAVARAQHNIIDLGFAHVPVITPEDLIVAKCFAVRNAPDRFQDLDDLKELLTHVKDLDIDYTRRTLQIHGLAIPEPVQKFAPASLR